MPNFLIKNLQTQSTKFIKLCNNYYFVYTFFAIDFIYFNPNSFIMFINNLLKIIIWIHMVKIILLITSFKDTFCKTSHY